jgi:D-glycero-D-manno-heptose 1,7-bisphosphate phosphatase
MEDISTVFLDRDGVINRLRSDYVLSWDTFEFLPGAKEAIALLNAVGMRVVVVTNQRAVARGLLSDNALSVIHARMRAELAEAGAALDAVYVCPHDKAVCDCRKPEIGLFLQAQRDFPAITFNRSVVIGDSLSDMQAGSHLACRLLLITETGCVTEHANDNAPLAVQKAGIALDGCAPSLYDAVTRCLIPLVPERVAQL